MSIQRCALPTCNIMHGPSGWFLKKDTYPNGRLLEIRRDDPDTKRYCSEEHRDQAENLPANVVIPETHLPRRTLTVCPDGYLIINDQGQGTMSLFELDQDTRAALIDALMAQGGTVECDSPEPRRFESRQVDGVQLWTVWDVRADAPSDVDPRVYTSLTQANKSTARLNTLVGV